MATVTLGNIKFNWKGAWNSATAYVVDDVVSLSGSSYVCIQAGTNQNPSTATAYWEQMSSAGTNGTDLGTTLTTQGDIVYRDSSGLARLGAGTSGQLLQTGGTGANPSWTDAPQGGAISTQMATVNGTNNTTSTSYQSIGSGLSLTFTPASTSSKILLTSTLNTNGDYNHCTIFRGSTNLATAANSSCDRIVHQGLSGWAMSCITYLDTPNTSSAVTYEVKFKSSNGTAVYVGDGAAILNTLVAIEL